MAARLLLITPRNSYRIAPYLRAAKQLGIEVLVASDGEHSLIGALSEGLHINANDLDGSVALLQQAAGQHGFQGIIGTDDSVSELSGAIAERLNLAGNPPQAARYSHRKDLARRCLQQAKVAIPDFQTLTFEQIAAGQRPHLAYPLVLKPLSLSASRGVIRVDDEAQFQRAAERIRPLLTEQNNDEERNTLLLEQFLPGQEVALEGMLDHGQLQLLTLFDKPEPLNGPFFEESYYITPSRLPATLQAKILAVTADACRAYGLRHGPIHAELRVNADQVWILEVAARTIGGQCGRLLTFGSGHTLEELVIAQAMGKPLALKKSPEAVGVLMIPIPKAGLLRRVEGVMAAEKVPYITSLEISLYSGYELVPLPEGSSYLGFIFAKAPTPELVEAALREAHDCLKIVIAPLWKIG
ncbi:MAG: ATP-grasp domain-containing protein [Gammaproteobacteria bacterium]|nr:ATP-grasp domain-containing protein [Gammaproteobacteria bacterium]